ELLHFGPRYRGDLLGPGRRAGHAGIGVVLGPRARKPRAAHRVLGQHQVEHRGHQVLAHAPDRHAALLVGDLAVGGVDPGDLPRLAGPLGSGVHGQGRADVLQVQVPLSLALVTVAVPERAVGDDGGAGGFVIHHRFELGVLRTRVRVD